MHRQTGQPPARQLPAFLLMAFLIATAAAPAQVITHELLRSSKPAPNIGRITYSQDETCAIYVRGDAIYFTLLDGVSEPVRIYAGNTNVSRFLLSPDNSRAIFTRNAQLFVADLTGEGEDFEDTVVDLSVSPDQRWAVWSSRTSSGAYLLNSLRLTGTGQPRVLREFTARPNFSLTNGHIAFRENGLLYVAPSDGESEPVLISPEFVDYRTDQHFLYYSLRDASLGRLFTYAVLPSAPVNHIALDPHPSSPIAMAQSIPAISSPDGSQIASWRDRRGRISPTGLALPVEISPRTSMLASLGTTCRWSPDSRFVCFSFPPQLYLIDAHEPLQLTLLNEQGAEWPLFSQDSSKLVYMGSNRRLFVVDLPDGNNTAAFNIPMNSAGPYLDSGSTWAYFPGQGTFTTINLRSLQMQSFAPQWTLVSQPEIAVVSRIPGSFLVNAVSNGNASRACYLELSDGAITELTPPAETLPSEMSILGVGPSDQSVYIQVDSSVDSPNGIYACAQGEPGALTEVFDKTIDRPEKKFQFAGNRSDAYFIAHPDSTVFRSRGGGPAKAAFEAAQGHTTNRLTMSPSGEFALLSRGHYVYDYDPCCYYDECGGSCFGCDYSYTYYFHEVAGSEPAGESPFLDSAGFSPAIVKIEPTRNRFLTAMNVDFDSNYDPYISLIRDGDTSIIWNGRLLGAAAQIDAAISEQRYTGNSRCQLPDCRALRISRVYLDDAIPGGDAQLDTFHTYDAIAPTQYSEPAERLLLQPTDHTLQTLAIAPGALPVIVDDFVESERDGLVVSPDGLYAAYIRTPSETGHPTVCTLALKSDTPARELALWTPGSTFTAIDSLSFSPASNALLFIATESSGNVCLYTAAPDATVPAIRRTPAGLQVDRYIVSPDSAWIAYAARGANAPEDGVLTWHSVPLFGGYNAPIIETDDTLEGDPVWAGGNLYWIAKEETARVLYAAERPLAPPAFTTQPKPPLGPLNVGRSTFLAVRLAQPGSAALQWEFAPALPGGGLGRYTPLANGNGIRGATSHALRLNVTAPGAQFAGRYRCTASNPGGTAFSRPIDIAVE